MFGSEVVDVGIGVTLLFLFMSLIASALREIIEAVMKSRAADLERGLKELLRSKDGRQKLVETFYNHPFIATLYKGEAYVAGSKDLPSYIPRQSAALAILDMVAKTADPKSELSVASLEASLAKIEAPDAVHKVISTALATAHDDLESVRKTVEDWFDSTMDRVSGWYTRRTSYILGGIGLGAAVFFNVDAITVTKSLIKDKQLRAVVVQQAEEVSKTAAAEPKGNGAKKGSLEEVSSDFTKIGFPIGWLSTDKRPIPKPQMCVVQSEKPKLAGDRNVTLNADGSITIPEGDFDYRCVSSAGQWVSTLLGWLITALAITLGAPFWFDLLNKFMIVRSTIKPKEKSPDEASADRRGSGRAPKDRDPAPTT